jgi:DNA processing protein
MPGPELDARLRLTLAQGLGPTLIQRLETQFGGPVAAADASASQLATVEGIGQARARAIRQAIEAADLDAEWRAIEADGVELIAIDDPRYPPLLKHIHDPPPLLYLRGGLERRDSLGLAVVGSRKCTAYGREQAERLGAAAAQAGLTIISGGARGIDAAAHRGALRVNERSIAVMGCGLAACYPPEHTELFDRIADQGALLSEFPMSTPPVAQNFPRRNRLISGLSLGVLVVEAANRSGALITARLAAEEHHREVMALPGRVDSHASAGCHRIIREGWAQLVTNAADILDALGETGQLLRGAGEPDHDADENTDDATPVALATLTDTQRRLYEAIDREPTDLDAVARSTGLPAGTMQADLTMLELRGLIQRAGGNRARRRQ